MFICFILFYPLVEEHRPTGYLLLDGVVLDDLFDLDVKEREGFALVEVGVFDPVVDFGFVDEEGLLNFG